jgi:hypothetical protein
LENRGLREETTQHHAGELQKLGQCRAIAPLQLGIKAAAAFERRISPSFAKLNLGHQKHTVVLKASPSFEPELASLSGVTIVRDRNSFEEFEFLIAFVTEQKEIAGLSKIIAAKAKGDAVVWFAYPKGASKKYKSEASRSRLARIARPWI